MDNLEKLRSSYYPKSGFKVLFIGESPPAGGTFFYLANSNLHKYTKDAFSEVLSQEWQDQNAFLDYFKGIGCYLDDLCYEPINKLPEDERLLMRKKAEICLAHRIKCYNPEVIIIVMKAIEENVRNAIDIAGIDISHVYALPFPVRGYQQRYVDGLKRILGILIENKILRLYTPVRLEFVVQDLPPKKDGAQSMWGKSLEADRLIALRQAALAAFSKETPLNKSIKLKIEIHVGRRLSAKTTQSADLTVSLQ